MVASGSEIEETDGDGFVMSGPGVVIDQEDLDGSAVFSGKRGNPRAITAAGQPLTLKLVEKLESKVAGFGLEVVSDKTPAGGIRGAGVGAVNNFKSKQAVDFTGKTSGQRYQMDTGITVVVPGIWFGVGTDFGNQAFNIKILGIVA